MQKHRVARIAVATLLGLGALLFAKIYLVDGWGELQLKVYVVMACTILLMIIGSAGLFLRANWGRVASLAFFYLALAFTLLGGISAVTLIALLALVMVLAALHAMKPERQSSAPDLTEK